MAEIAELAQLSRQAMTNLRQRDHNFPAPVADLRSGPVFYEADILDYLASRGRNAQPLLRGSVKRNRIEKFNPLDRLNLAKSVENALLDEPQNPLPPAEPFPGAGLYCIYYSGDFPAYEPIVNAERQVPIYVGRAIPRGARAGFGGLLNSVEEPVLFNRLREHSRSIKQVEEFGMEDGGTPQLKLSD
ncbi:Eco29kI family restriction endonuclease, partial [Amycolatopsis lurida]|uniref:Eco29kI family restriction endonuclease n=1 Tax=Amycolatopsis lurida TaxID=31959 RepID=UPI00364F1ED4